MKPNYFPNLTPDQTDKLTNKMAGMPNGELPPLDNTPVTPNVQAHIIHEDAGFTPSIEPIQQKATNSTNLKARIAEFEKELGTTTNLSLDDKTFIDEVGNETFYVRNIAGRHVLISDIERMPKIPVGSVMDLLKHAKLEDLKGSRDLRVALLGVGLDKTLERLTELQYMNAVHQAVVDKRKIDVLRQQEALRHSHSAQQNTQEVMPHDRPTQAQPKRIRTAIESKLGKLALRNDPNPQNSMLALTTQEFIQWVQGERFTHSEIEHIMAHPSVIKEHDIRAELLKKKSETPPE